jgi:hypothetical protein
MTMTHDSLDQPPVAELPDPDIIRDLPLDKLTGLSDPDLTDILVVLLAYANGIIRPVVT